MVFWGGEYLSTATCFRKAQATDPARPLQQAVNNFIPGSVVPQHGHRFYGGLFFVRWLDCRSVGSY